MINKVDKTNVVDYTKPIVILYNESIFIIVNPGSS